MISINLQRGDEPTFSPNEKIAGNVQWSDLPTETETMEVRLIWHTVGKGDQDAQFVETKELTSVEVAGQTDFEFTAPHRPNSFEGQLIAIQWAIEVILFPQREAEQATLRISPPAGEVVLTPVEDEEIFWNQWSFGKRGRLAALKRSRSQ